MAKDTPKTSSSSKTDKPDDPVVARLQKETARLLARRELADAKQATLVGLTPGVTDAPKNTVTLGEKAGSLAPWIANCVLAGLAQAIASGVWGLLSSQSASATRSVPEDAPAPEPEPPTIIFVTHDAGLLAGDVVGRQVTAAMRGRTQELTAAAGQLSDGVAALEQAIKRYGDEESQRDEGDRRRLRRVVVAQAEVAAAVAAQEAKSGVPDQAVEAGAAGDEPVEAVGAEEAGAATGPIGAAIDLVRLLATDYTITAAEVSVSSGVLARLTAGSIPTSESRGDQQAQVLLDGFSLAEGSSTLKTYEKLIASANKVRARADRLSAKAAPVAAEAEAYRSAVERAQEGWEKTAADAKAAPGSADELKDTLEELTDRMNSRLSASATAQETVADGESVGTAARMELAALVTPDDAGISPLQRACSRDRLHDTNALVTHVLLVEATHAGADIVTRRSILGSSGRVGYLGGANAAWVMIDARTGAVVGGASANKASQMTHDMAAGESRQTDIMENASLSSADPLEKNEQWLRIGVLSLALALVLLSVAATLAVLFPGIHFG